VTITRVIYCVGGVISPVLANLFMHYAFDTWMDREFPDCPFERYADDAVVHCRSEARARQVLAALEQRMEQVGLRLHPDKTKIVYCKDGNRRRPHDGPVSSDFLGFTFRARSMSGKHGRFTGYGPAISGFAMAKLSQEVRDWKLHRHVNLTEAEIAQWINPIVRGWMNSYGKFRRSALYPLLARINYYLIKWMRRKYKRFSALKAAMKAWSQAVASRPGYFAHWRWVTSPWQ
jgi:hypothetical protein